MVKTGPRKPNIEVLAVRYKKLMSKADNNRLFHSERQIQDIVEVLMHPNIMRTIRTAIQDGFRQ